MRPLYLSPKALGLKNEVGEHFLKPRRRPAIGSFIWVQVFCGSRDMFSEGDCCHMLVAYHVQENVGERVGSMVAELAAMAVMRMWHD